MSAATVDAPRRSLPESREAESLQLVRDLIAAAKHTGYGVITIKIPIESFVLQEPSGELVTRVRPPRPRG